VSAISQFLPLPELLRLLGRHEVDARYRGRALGRILFSAALEPLCWAERLRWGARLASTRIEEPPVFLLGFGRSGTTHLHNLMAQDPGFGVVTSYQASMQPIALIGRGWLDRLVERRLPRTRPMDNVAVSLGSPQEEEIALANATADAALHFMSFPRALPGIYDRWVCELGTDAGDLERWQRAYLGVLKKATILAGGRRLVLKTPTHTGRVSLLLRMFPGARFVHIVRNPYPVHQSMRNMYRKILDAQVLQDFDWDAIDAWMIEAYRSLMMRYLDERKQIDPGRLVEVRFEDLDERPLEVLEAIYQKLDLGDFAALRPRFERYLEGLGRFEKNRFELPAEIVATVNERWGFAFDAFGYERLVPGAPPARGEA